MTISSTINRKEYTGNGATTSFSFPYYVLAAADLKVYQNGTLKTLTTHYTLSGSAPYDSGTNVQFVTAPASNDKIVILRDPAATQSLDLVENDPLPAEELEKAYDRLTMLIQRLAERVDRVFRLADTDVSGASVTVPTPQPNQVLGWNSDGTALVNTTALTGGYAVSPFAATVLDDADAAAARATLDLGSMATQAASGVTISGGSITGITDLAIADGGTGASTAAAAFANLKQQGDSSATGVWRAGTNTEQLAGALSNVACTPAGLASSQSKATNGYIKHPGGLIDQWGATTVNVDVPAGGYSVTITFPIAFPNAVYSATATTYSQDSGDTRAVYPVLTGLSLSQATFQCYEGTGNVQANWKLCFTAKGS